MADVPEEDGVIYIKNENKTKDILNSFVQCEVTDVSNYDLIGKLV